MAWTVTGCGRVEERVKGVVVVCFHRSFTSQRLAMGLEPVVATEGLCVSGALFNFLSVLEEPAGPGNESANRSHEEEDCVPHY